MVVHFGSVAMHRRHFFLSCVFLTGLFYLGGCSLIQPRTGNDLVAQNNVRFLHAYRDARADLSKNDFQKARSIAASWERYPHLNADNRRLLSDLLRRVRRERSIYRMGEARQLEVVGHLNEALAMVDRASRLDPAWKRPQKARRHLVILIEVQNQMNRQWKSLVTRLLVLRKEESPNAELDRTLAWSYRHLAESRYSSNHLAGAYRSVKKSLLLDPSSAEAKDLESRIIDQVKAHTLEGEDSFRHNHISKAIAFFRKALSIRPKDLRAKQDLDLALDAQALGTKTRDRSQQQKATKPAPRL